MRRAIMAALLGASAAGLAAAGQQAAFRAGPMSGFVHSLASVPAAAQRAAATGEAGRVLYWRHPDRPAYAAEPRRTEDGREWRPVRAGEDAEPGDPAAPRPASAAGPRRILYYRNPMGLPDTSPIPKKDSMGMDYVPVYEGEDVEDGVVRVAPGRLQTSGVRSELAVRRVVARPVRAPGTIQLDERRVAVVALRAESFVERVEDVTTGDRVRRGQPLLRLYSPEVAAAAAQYISALAFPGAGGGGADGARRRLENFAVPPAVLAEVERTRRPPLSFAWPAPRDGVVLERAAVEGMRALPGQVLFRIADLAQVWVLVDVPEREMGQVAVGQPVAVRARGLPGRTFEGHVALLYPQLDMQTRTARLRVELANPDGALLPGMFAEAEVAAGGAETEPVVAVANGAVIATGTRQLVILDRGGGRFEPREVKTGRRGEAFTEIREGVAEGDRVVVSANFLIDAESNLRAALRGLSAATAPTTAATEPAPR
ncbi:MAG: efflux RND transporter periplasmic adaptor subunit [Acetobacteraceae bacterium]|nr:efflux RND transporter periplasmic adaptor subunit [Acetobacteraceae bacterium]